MHLEKEMPCNSTYNTKRQRPIEGAVAFYGYLTYLFKRRKQKDRKNMRTGFFIYKYVKDGQIIYLGKTKRPLNQRINEHKHKKDLPDGCDIYYFECVSESDMNIAELFLIDKYKPIYNKDCNNAEAQTTYSFVEPVWKPITNYYAPVLVFKEYRKTPKGLRAIYINMRTGNERMKKVHYCECDVDFPEIIKCEKYSYTICTACGHIVRNTFKENTELSA